MSSIRSNSSNEKKCNVYVHQVHKLPKPSNSYLPQSWLEGSSVHQNSYRHELNDYYDIKIKTLKKQFDNLSLGTKQTPLASPYKIPNAAKAGLPNKPSKFPSTKSNPMASKANKRFLFKPEHKAAIDKLEETYWSKWKPNKLVTKECNMSNPKVKGLYTENDQPKIYHHVSKTEQKERGDSNQELTLNETEEETTEEASISTIAVPEVCVSHQIQVPEIDSDEITENPLDDKSEYDNMQLSIIKPTSTKEETVPSYSKIIIVQKSSSEISVNLKHTDSFIILSAKKQTEEKERFQQPKCIKLFKNIGYSSSTPINYIKGGTYPLKSCLKKEGSFMSKSSYLSPPSGAVKILNNRKLNRASRLSK